MDVMAPSAINRHESPPPATLPALPANGGAPSTETGHFHAVTPETRPFPKVVRLSSNSVRVVPPTPYRVLPIFLLCSECFSGKSVSFAGYRS